MVQCPTSTDNQSALLPCAILIHEHSRTPQTSSSGLSRASRLGNQLIAVHHVTQHACNSWPCVGVIGTTLTPPTRHAGLRLRQPAYLSSFITGADLRFWTSARSSVDNRTACLVDSKPLWGVVFICHTVHLIKHPRSNRDPLPSQRLPAFPFPPSILPFLHFSISPHLLFFPPLPPLPSHPATSLNERRAPKTVGPPAPKCETNRFYHRTQLRSTSTPHQPSSASDARCIPPSAAPPTEPS